MQQLHAEGGHCIASNDCKSVAAIQRVDFVQDKENKVQDKENKVQDKEKTKFKMKRKQSSR